LLESSFPFSVEAAACGEGFSRERGHIADLSFADPSFSDKFEFSFLNANLMASPSRRPIFHSAAKDCTPQKGVDQLQIRSNPMKTLNTKLVLSVLGLALLATPAFAQKLHRQPSQTSEASQAGQYLNGDQVTGSAANQIDHATGSYATGSDQ
jgi:hypothetical protein